MKPKKIIKDVVILGAGITGLSAGYVSGLPIYEARSVAGGICTSYYMSKNKKGRSYVMPKDEEAYHFETGGGHWIFGGDPVIKKFINTLSPHKIYTRISSVYLPKQKLLVPYPIQNNLAFLDKKTRDKALKEILSGNKAIKNKKIITMSDWLTKNFGNTLCDLFFNPFHEMYTARLWEKITPQDGYKSPINKEDVIDGHSKKARDVGYNATFLYPEKGLDHLSSRLAKKCDIHYNKKVKKIDLKNKIIYFADKSSVVYKEIISTLPLNHMMKMTGITTKLEAFPSPSVLVVNIGAKKGRLHPKDQWVYIPKSKAGFHRVGFYDNVDPMFLPKSSREKQDCTSIYVEKAYAEGEKPTAEEIDKICKDIIGELQSWEWIGEMEVYDPTWIDVAYTWSWPKSNWKETALKELEKNSIYQIGRYGRWIFQGIADSIKDGLMIGAAFSKK